MTLGILGGGLTGLSLAYFLGSDCEVLERDAVCGGCAENRAKGIHAGVQGRAEGLPLQKIPEAVAMALRTFPKLKNDMRAISARTRHH